MLKDEPEFPVAPAWPDQDGLGRLIQEAGWADVAYRNLSAGIVALHRATPPGHHPARTPPRRREGKPQQTHPVAVDILTRICS